VYTQIVKPPIKTPAQAIQDVIVLVDGMHLKKVTKESLEDKLQSIIKAFNKDHDQQAMKHLEKLFIKINDMDGKPIQLTQATRIVNALQEIINSIQ